MSDTKHLDPAPPHNSSRLHGKSALPPKIRWWRKIRSSVLAISILIHVLFALIAGYFVVQHFKQPAKPFPISATIPPKSPRITPAFKSSGAPTAHQITTITDVPVRIPDIIDPTSSDMPPTTLPGANATGLGAIQGISLPSGLQNQNPMGDPNLQGGLEGRFYDLKQDVFRKPTGVHMDEYASAIKKYVTGGWKESDLARFYASPGTLHIYQFFIPDMDAARGPAAFHMEKKVAPTLWLAHYHGNIIAPETARYHFVGAGDDVMLVGFADKLVLDRCWNLKIKDSTADYDYGYTGIPGGFARGDAVDVVAGHAYPMDVLIGEEPGGKMFAFLMIEKEGESYPRDARGNPILPIFRVDRVALPAVEPEVALPPYSVATPAWSVWQVAPAAR